MAGFDVLEAHDRKQQYQRAFEAPACAGVALGLLTIGADDTTIYQRIHDDGQKQWGYCNG